jgi:glyoxylase-like metal-dependent hydrolase (beta-lactamase superfamily II)
MMPSRPEVPAQRPLALSRVLPALLSLVLVGAAAWLGGAQERPANAWQEAAPGVFRTPGFPAGYALVDDGHALLIDAPAPLDGLKAQGVRKIEGALLTHHHWDACAQAAPLLAEKIPVRASKQAAEWLTPDNVRKYWQESIPLRHSRAAYLVAPLGLEGVDCSLQDGQKIEWRGWTIQVVGTPGHSRDHLAFAARKGKDGPLLVFSGDALASAGKLWTPYTTDWNHWTDEGLKPAAESLHKLAALKPARVLPAHGPVIAADAAAVLTKTADLTAEVGFMKSFERYTKQRLGNAPEYAFLAKSQAGSNGKEPWTMLSPHLFLTGNTYVITSKDGPFLVLDPWGKLGADQIEKLRADRKLGDLEVMMFSHAHYDHYDGIYDLPNREKFQVWTLDRVAAPIADPFQWRAPFLDARPVKIDRRLKDGETAAWREYRFRFQFFPGQSEFSMAVHTTIDGKKCVFTADNFFHQDQFSGSGGWMGLNRSFPLPYAESAQKVLDAAPDWVLAEHGGAFEFNAEDFKRRVRWGQACATACDAVSPSGGHRRDWDPHHVHVEPLLQKAKPGDTVKVLLVANNPLGQAAKFSASVLGRELLGEQTIALEVPMKSSGQREFSVRLSEKAPVGRHVFVLRVLENDEPDSSDAFFVIDVE